MSKKRIPLGQSAISHTIPSKRSCLIVYLSLHTKRDFNLCETLVKRKNQDAMLFPSSWCQFFAFITTRFYCANAAVHALLSFSTFFHSLTALVLAFAAACQPARSRPARCRSCCFPKPLDFFPQASSLALFTPRATSSATLSLTLHKGLTLIVTAAAAAAACEALMHGPDHRLPPSQVPLISTFQS